MSELRICNQCNHRLGFDRCGHPDVSEFDLVTGEETQPYCRVQREIEGKQCGPEGKLWEPLIKPYRPLEVGEHEDD